MEQGKPNIMWNIILFIATISSTIFAGYYLSLPLVMEGRMENVWAGAVSFSAAIMFILGTHELGHKYASHKNGVDATWPYFIPMPFIFIGTMGALIKSRSPMPDNNSMIQLGAAGPLCGFLVAIPVYIIGIKLSYIVPAVEPAEGETFLYFGQSIITEFLGGLVLQVPSGADVFLHPIAIAAWAALLVTSVNLIPVGQLDGGHIARALLGERLHRMLSYALIGIMVVMGFPYYNPFFVWEGWLIWALVLYFIIMRARSGGAMNELEPITINSKILALAALVVFIITVIPIPLGIVTG
jgi:membrane-associated protease RseP (regulator of RpoE activity)